MNHTSRDLKKKLNRFEPIVKNSQLVLDQEVMRLAHIRRKVEDAQKEMASKQNDYYHWLERINGIRSSGDRSMLLELESGLDIIKEQCFVIYKQIHLLKQHEKQQIEKIDRCRMDCSAKEKLRDRYQEAYIQKREMEQTKAMDEMTTLRYARRGP